MVMPPEGLSFEKTYSQGPAWLQESSASRLCTRRSQLRRTPPPGRSSRLSRCEIKARHTRHQLQI